MFYLRIEYRHLFFCIKKINIKMISYIVAAAALRGVAFTRGRARGAYTAAAAAAAFRHPATLATAATGLPYTA